MSGSILTTYEKDGFGLIDVADGRTVSAQSDLVAAILRFWSSEETHTLILADPARCIAVAEGLRTGSVKKRVVMIVVTVEFSRRHDLAVGKSIRKCDLDPFCSIL